MKMLSGFLNKMILLPLIIGVIPTFAQTVIDITGKVTDIADSPVAGAVVTLVKLPNISTITKTDGSYSIKQTPIQNGNQGGLEPSFSFFNNSLIVNQTKKGAITISLHNVKGTGVLSK